MLRIDGNPSTRPAATRARGEAHTAIADTGFARQLGIPATTLRSAPSPSMAAASPSAAMLALQEIRTPAARRRQAISRGGRLLDMLGQLEVALLDDAGPAAVVDRLRSHLEERREDSDDAALNELLDAIDLRALVELAKLERDAGPAG